MLCAKGVMWATKEEARIPQAITGSTIAIASYIGITLPDLCIAMIMGALLDKHADNVGQAYSIFFLILQGLCVVGAIACIRPRAKPYENSTLDFQFYDSVHEIGCQDSSTEKLAMPASGTVCIDYRNLQKIGLPKCKTEQRSFQNMKATGIVRRIDDLGRVVIPKEIRRTMRIREGDPLEIYTDTDGQVIFKKYSPMGELSEFAAQICDALHKTTGGIAAVCDRDAVIAVAGTETVKSICTSPPTMLTSTSSNSFPSAMPSASPPTMATSAIMTDSHASTLARLPLPMPRML